MLVLAMDVSGPATVLGISRNGKILGTKTLPVRERHSSSLIPTTEELLSDTALRLSDMDGFGVTIGPGSFTGLRIGLATVKAWAWSLGRRIAPIHSLEALATEAGPSKKPVIATLPSRRGYLYVARYKWTADQLASETDTLEVPINELKGMIKDSCCILGRFSEDFKLGISRSFPGIEIEFREIPNVSPETLCRLTEKAFNQGLEIDASAIDVLYSTAQVASVPFAQQSKEQRA